MSKQEQAKRARLVTQVLGARSLPEVDAAEAALHGWLKAHPEDRGMRDAFEQLANMREIAEVRLEEARAQVTAAAEPVPR